MNEVNTDGMTWISQIGRISQPGREEGLGVLERPATSTAYRSLFLTRPGTVVWRLVTPPRSAPGISPRHANRQIATLGFVSFGGRVCVTKYQGITRTHIPPQGTQHRL